VILDYPVTRERRAFLLAHDTDPFNKWEAGRTLARDVLEGMVLHGGAAGADYLEALEKVARDDRLDPAFRALTLRLPGEDEMAQVLFEGGHVPDPDAIRAAREDLLDAIAQHLGDTLAELYDAMETPGPYSPGARDAGRRSLREAALLFLSRLDGGARAARQFKTADNMTEQLGALACLLRADVGEGALAAFYRQWAKDRLVLDKWFGLQVINTPGARAVQVADTLTRHPDFDWKNPNRFRATLGTLAMNPTGFHAADGSGYRLLADWILRLDPLNPQTAARVSTAFETWRRYDTGRQALVQGELGRILAAPGLSRDLREMAGRMLGAG
jgi:aminopeptidase N